MSLDTELLRVCICIIYVHLMHVYTHLSVLFFFYYFSTVFCHLRKAAKKRENENWKLRHCSHEFSSTLNELIKFMLKMHKFSDEWEIYSDDDGMQRMDKMYLHSHRITSHILKLVCVNCVHSTFGGNMFIRVVQWVSIEEIELTVSERKCRQLKCTPCRCIDTIYAPTHTHTYNPAILSAGIETKIKWI